MNEVIGLLIDQVKQTNARLQVLVEHQKFLNQKMSELLDYLKRTTAELEPPAPPDKLKRFTERGTK